MVVVAEAEAVAAAVAGMAKESPWNTSVGLGFGILILQSEVGDLEFDPARRIAPLAGVHGYGCDLGHEETMEHVADLALGIEIKLFKLVMAKRDAKTIRIVRDHGRYRHDGLFLFFGRSR